ncbi:hypothetical protein DVH24_017180 [Malus domestica]|uniref:Tyrosinase copper-binding domain-containing protein n=1 Tax=Malus domestica TaxID=3750 RepID=A0A498IVC1_MALDO|nr:hypothetical protein DVH24_017180 [Malus domestica]
MASFLPLAPATTLINRPSSIRSNTSTSLSCFPRPLFSIHRSFEKGKHGSPCKARKSDDEQGINQDDGKLDRRNMLIGLGAGGLYGATSLGLGTNPFATAVPIPAPDLKTCVRTTEDMKGLNCCPPSTEIINFELPEVKTLRTRPAAHTVDQKYIENYKTAIELMKNLPEDDPRNFWNQAQVHCAYCEGAYYYASNDCDGTKEEIQVHSSWLFYPFHRWYLYFYERILAKLIKDPNFALPFWNWDGKDGMYLPPIFEEGRSSSPLFDHYRNAKHRKEKFVLDLNYNCTDSGKTDEEIKEDNLCTMHRQMYSASTGKDLRLFFGHPYRKGDKPSPGAGNIERIPHNNVHIWTGDPDWVREDMGNLYSAARDPIFFAHHANVDRMWYLWKKELHCKDISQDDWLKAEFLFYNENKQLVRVNVEQSLDTDKLGYKYDDDVDIEWMSNKYKPKARKSLNKAKPNVSRFPVKLDSKASVKVQRASLKQPANEKAERAEVLLIEGIEFPGNQAVKFDVYVNDDADTESGPCNSEFAGSFVHVPHRHSHTIKTNMTLGITDLLQDLEAEDDSHVVVTLVPRYGKGPITIGFDPSHFSQILDARTQGLDFPYNNIHIWCGDPNHTNQEDMDNFYYTGRDPLFYANHCNVDRMWNIWKTLGRKRNDPTDTDWFDAEFLFYDENAELVSCKVRDSIHPEKDLR